MEKSKELIYGLNGRPPIRETIFAALQRLLAILVVIITPSLIISSALKFDLDTIGFLMSISLFVSGLATFIRCRRFGPIGADFLCIQGAPFSFVGPIIGAGMLGMINGKMNIEMGLSYIFGTCLVASAVEMVVGRLLSYIRKITIPLVLGTVASLIGMCLIKAGINSYGGGQPAVDADTFGSMQNPGLVLLVLASIIFFNRSNNRFLCTGSIVLGLLTGYVVAYVLNMIDFSNLKSSGSLSIPVPFKYGLNLDLGTIIGIGPIYLVIAVEAFDDTTADSLTPGESVEGPVFPKRAQDGVLADGSSSFLTAVLNSFPNSIFAQNNGMVQPTGAASCYVGYSIAGALVLLGLFPVVGKVFSPIPDPVLGDIILLMFGTVAVAGIRVIALTEITRKIVLVIAISFAMGLSVELALGTFGKMPDIIKNIFSSGTTTDGLTAILANAFTRIKE